MNEYIYCGFWRRVTAAFLDAIILSLLCILLIMISFLVTPYITGPTEITAFHAIAWFFAPILISTFLILPIFESSAKQATIGCRRMGMKLINVNGTKITFLKSFIRINIIIIIKSTLIIELISILCVIFTKEKTFLHDIICQTRMVRN